MRRLCVLLAPLAIASSLAASGQADDFITTHGPLDDEAFYRLVACGAAPGGACTKPMMRWPTARPLRVAILRIDRAYLGGKQARARAALTRAVQYINAAGAGIALEETARVEDADIKIYFLETDEHTPVEDTGIEGIDGSTVSGARVMIWGDAARREILRARIVFGTRLDIRDYESAMLEEVTQALGLMTDIRNPLYDGVSVFAQDSNEAKQLGPQDIMALRRHYPPRTP